MRRMLAAALALALAAAACSPPAATPLVTPEPAFVETQRPAPVVTDAPVADAPVRVVDADEPRSADEDFVSFDELIAEANCEQLPALAQLVLDDPTVPDADALAIVEAIAAAERQKGC